MEEKKINFHYRSEKGKTQTVIYVEYITIENFLYEDFWLLHVLKEDFSKFFQMEIDFGKYPPYTVDVALEDSATHLKLRIQLQGTMLECEEA